MYTPFVTFQMKYLEILKPGPIPKVAAAASNASLDELKKIL